MTGRPQEPAPITHTLGRALLMPPRENRPSHFFGNNRLRAFHEQQVLFRPDAGQPGLEPLAERGVVRVVALRHPPLDRALADVDDHPCEPPAAKIPEGGRPRPVGDGDVEHRVQDPAHRGQHERDTAGPRRQQLAVRRRGLHALGVGESRAFDEIHHRGGHPSEPIAGATRRLEILAAQVRMAREELGRVSAHEGKVERPPGEPEQRHPDQLALQEELQERYAAVEDRLQHQDIDPGAVIRHDQVPLSRLESLDAGDAHRHRAHHPEDRAVARDPAFRKHRKHAAGPLPPRGDGHYELQHRHQHQRDDPEDKIESHQGDRGHTFQP